MVGALRLFVLWWDIASRSSCAARPRRLATWLRSATQAWPAIVEFWLLVLGPAAHSAHRVRTKPLGRSSPLATPGAGGRWPVRRGVAGVGLTVFLNRCTVSTYIRYPVEHMQTMVYTLQCKPVICAIRLCALVRTPHSGTRRLHRPTLRSIRPSAERRLCCMLSDPVCYAPQKARAASVSGNPQDV